MSTATTINRTRSVTTDVKIRPSLEQELQRRVDGEVRFDVGSQAAYAMDSSNYRQVPLAVVAPKTVDAAVAAIAVCADLDVPVLSRGSGTSLTGQTTNRRHPGLDEVLSPPRLRRCRRAHLRRRARHRAGRAQPPAGRVRPDVRAPPVDAPAWRDMARALRNIGRSGLGAMALSAVDNALWDLKARLLGLPLHRLLGTARESVPVYGSGGFTTYDQDQLAAQLGWWLDDGISAVKIKIGEAWGTRERRDLDRVEQTLTVVSAAGRDVEVFVDANGGYTVGQAVRVGHALDALGVTWFEEPVSSDDLTGLRTVRRATRLDVAAGEYIDRLDAAQRLCAAHAVDCLQVDVTRCGGITELLRIAAVAAAHHLDVSGHCSPYQHAPVLAAIPNLRHLEYFHDHARIEQLLFAGTVPPREGLLALPDAPGNGTAFTPERAASFAVKS